MCSNGRQQPTVGTCIGCSWPVLLDVVYYSLDDEGRHPCRLLGHDRPVRGSPIFRLRPTKLVQVKQMQHDIRNIIPAPQFCGRVHNENILFRRAIHAHRTGLSL